LWILEHNTQNKSQRWHFTRIPSVADNAYVISPAENPEYGLIRYVDPTIDTHVMVRRMWGGPTPIFAWYIKSVPSDLEAVASS
jgi:hypothetical protein